MLALFLLLGAVVNIAVAWGCSLWSPLDHVKYKVRHSPEHDDWFRKHASDAEGDEWQIADQAQVLGATGVRVTHLFGYSRYPGRNRNVQAVFVHRTRVG